MKYGTTRAGAYLLARPANMSPKRSFKPEMSARAQTVRELHELIAALDRRVPQVRRAGEMSIARTAAALRVEALRRIEELERGDAGA